MHKSPILFLDIDGVLNKRSPIWNQQCCAMIDSVIEVINCDIVLSSAWRSLIKIGNISLSGFNILFQSHGIINANVIRSIDDDDFDAISSKSKLILADVDKHQPLVWCAIDDDDLGLPDQHFVRVENGCTRADADSLISKFTAQMKT